jgi:hypothetical protein
VAQVDAVDPDRAPAPAARHDDARAACRVRAASWRA